MPRHRMRSPHAAIAILALCGLAAAAGAAGAASPDAEPPAAAGPVAAYGFDGTGPWVADASGNANHGATTAPRIEDGRFGRALSLDRPRAGAIVPDDPSLRPLRTLTLEAWVRPEPGRGSRAILVKDGGGRVAYGLSTRGGRPQAVINSGSRSHVARADSPLRPRVWTHLTATYDGRSVRLLVGGAEVAETPASGTLLSARGPLRIGAGGTGGDRFLGGIDEVRVYGRALRRPEILRDMRRAVRSDPAGGSTTPVIVNPLPVRPITPTTPTRPAPRAAPVTPVTPPVTPAPVVPPVPPVDPPEPSPGGGTLQWGYVANADINKAVDSAASGHGTVVRMEFGIGTGTATIAPHVAYAASKGMEVVLQAGFHGTMPSVAQAQSLGQWARAFGPGGTFWSTRSDGRLASRFIEFGNESSYSYQGTQNRGGEYAQRFEDAYDAIQLNNPNLGLLAQADDGNCGCPTWVNGMAATVPNLGAMVAGWTVHPYGPESRWKPRIDRLIAQTAARGWSSDIPIDITEYGMATDGGASLSNNYDWPVNQTYQQAADAVTLTVNRMLDYEPLASRLRLFTYFQGHDQQPSGTGQREHYFGVVRNNGTDKGALTATLRVIADAHPAH